MDIEIGSVVRQDGGFARIIGNVEAFNMTTLDIRGAEVEGNLYIEGLSPNADPTNMRLRNTRVNGNVYVLNGTLSNRARVSASRVLPEPVGPISRMLLLAISTSSFLPFASNRL